MQSTWKPVEAIQDDTPRRHHYMNTSLAIIYLSTGWGLVTYKFCKDSKEQCPRILAHDGRPSMKLKSLASQRLGVPSVIS